MKVCTKQHIYATLFILFFSANTWIGMLNFIISQGSHFILDGGEVELKYN